MPEVFICWVVGDDGVRTEKYKSKADLLKAWPHAEEINEHEWETFSHTDEEEV